MNTFLSRARQAVLSASVLFTVLAPPLWAQTEPAATSNPASDKKIPVETRDVDDIDDTPIILSPFMISAEEDKGYQATSTLAGTRIKTDLKDVGSAISVYTGKFLKDTGARNNQDLLVYATNMEVGGLGGNFTGLKSSATLDPYPLMLAPQSNTRVRGLARADNTRDYFLSDLPWDGYNVSRVDTVRGPNAMLFGLGKPGGIINNTTNTAGFANKGSLEVRFDRWGSVRTSLDVNRVLIKDELAIRIDGVRDRQEFRQDPAYDLSKRVFGALRYDPQIIAKNGMRTSIRLNYEKGEIEANRPRQLPLVDKITPWFTEMNKATYDPFLVWTVVPGVPGSGARQPSNNGSPNPDFQPWLGQPSGGAQDGVRAIFSDPNSSTMTNLHSGGINQKFGLRPDGTVDGSIAGFPYSEWVGVASFSEYARNAKLPLYGYGQYKDTYIRDRSVFDYMTKLIDGPNKSEGQDFEAWDLNVSQTFFDNRLGLELVRDRQRYHEEQVSLMSNSQALEIDINLNNFDGTPNPNVGRPFISARPNFNNGGTWTNRQADRVTAFGELKFSDFMQRSLLQRILGRHIFTVMASNETYDRENRQWSRYTADQEYSRWVGNDKAVNVVAISYLGNSMLNADSFKGANISGITAKQLPQSGASVKVFDSRWNATGVNPADPWTDPSIFNTTGAVTTQADNPANYVGWVNRPVNMLISDHGDHSYLYRSAQKTRSEVISKGYTWQGYFWDGVIVPTIGLRVDTAKSYGVSGFQRADQTIDIHHPQYLLPEKPDNVLWNLNSHSSSLVVHTPKFIREKMPAKTGLSVFYSKSQNFEPSAGRYDILGNSITPPNAKTIDKGFMISTLNDRLTLKINWYETKALDDNVSNVSTWQLTAAECWGEIFAMQAYNLYGGFASGYATIGSQTPAEAEAVRVSATNAWIANRPSTQFDQFWKIDRSQWSSWINANGGQGFTVTGDSMSKGIEYELTAQLTKGWSMSLNASKTKATQSNLSASFKKWVEDRMAVYNGPAGDIRLWWNGGEDTIKTFMNREFMPGYRLWLLQQGTNTAELRPWHFNGVTDYRFSKGILKNVNVGGAYRWEDKVIIGYPLKKTGQQDPSGNDLYDFDIANPYRGPSQSSFDMWFGYERKLRSKINWRIQLNLRNVLASDKLIPITAQPDGTPAAYRIPDAMNWTITNTLSF